MVNQIQIISSHQPFLPCILYTSMVDFGTRSNADQTDADNMQIKHLLGTYTYACFHQKASS